MIAVAASSAPSASAASPIDLGPGANQHVAVDASGTAHITWGETLSGQLADVAHYCQIAKGGAACSNSHSFTYPSGANQGSDSGVWPLLPGGSRVLVLDARCCSQYAAKFLYSSADGGATFDAGSNVGNDNNLGADIQGSAAYATPGALGRSAESVLTFGSLATIGLSFQATGTVGPPASSSSANVLTQGDAISGSLGLSGNTLIAAWTSIDDNFVYWRQWSGQGDVNDAASWTPITRLDLANIDSNSRLAAGPSGIYIAYNTGAPGSEKAVERRFAGSGWASPQTLADPATNQFDLVEDSAGALHFAWRGADDKLLYRFSTTPGDSHFSSPQQILGPNSNFAYGGLRLGVGTGSAFATWEDGSPAHVRALPFKPSALAPPTEGSTVNVVPVKGKVLVKLASGTGNAKAGGGFVPLESIGRQIPVGSTLDTTKGTVRLFSAANNTGKSQHGDFSRGLFNSSQGRKNPLTTVSMTGGGLKTCGKVPAGGSPKSALSAAKKRKKRSLFSNVHGRFRARGRNSTATVRGTAFTMTDTCTGTLTQVSRGSVLVRDLRLRKTRTIKAGHSYLARSVHH